MLKDHVVSHLENYDETLEILTGDSSYGSEENYTDLEDKEITAFIKFNHFQKEL